MKEKNFGLDQSAFDQLLADLKAGKEQLFEKIFLAHFQDCMNYLRRNHRATHEDAYDATMDAMVVFCERLKAGKIQYGNLRFLFTQIAGQIYIRWIKKEQLNTDINHLDLEEAPPEQLDKETLQLLNKAWLQLGAKCQELLKEFYYGGIALNEIAEQLGKTSAAIRKQKQRCVEQLRILFNKLF